MSDTDALIVSMFREVRRSLSVSMRPMLDGALRLMEISEEGNVPVGVQGSRLGGWASPLGYVPITWPPDPLVSPDTEGHLYRVQVTGAAPYQCSSCGKEFTDPRRYGGHLASCRVRNPGKRCGLPKPIAKITEATVRAVLEASKRPMTRKEIQSALGVSVASKKNNSRVGVVLSDLGAEWVLGTLEGRGTAPHVYSLPGTSANAAVGEMDSVDLVDGMDTPRETIIPVSLPAPENKPAKPARTRIPRPIPKAVPPPREVRLLPILPEGEPVAFASPAIPEAVIRQMPGLPFRVMVLNAICRIPCDQELASAMRILDAIKAGNVHYKEAWDFYADLPEGKARERFDQIAIEVMTTKVTGRDFKKPAKKVDAGWLKPVTELM